MRIGVDFFIFTIIIMLSMFICNNFIAAIAVIIRLSARTFIIISEIFRKIFKICFKISIVCSWRRSNRSFNGMNRIIRTRIKRIFGIIFGIANKSVENSVRSQNRRYV